MGVACADGPPLRPTEGPQAGPEAGDGAAAAQKGGEAADAPAGGVQVAAMACCGLVVVWRRPDAAVRSSLLLLLLRGGGGGGGGGEERGDPAHGEAGEEGREQPGGGELFVCIGCMIIGRMGRSGEVDGRRHTRTHAHRRMPAAL